MRPKVLVAEYLSRDLRPEIVYPEDDFSFCMILFVFQFGEFLRQRVLREGNLSHDTEDSIT
jgi:hypothetical protein